MIASASELLLLWERAVVQRPAVRPVALLAMEGNAADLPVGTRNVRLFRLRERLLGPLVGCLSRCPHCNERVEFEFTAADVLVPEDPPAELTATCEDYELRFRRPTAGDLAAVGDAPVAMERPPSEEAPGERGLPRVIAGASSPTRQGATDGARQLFGRCLLEVRRSGVPVSADEVPESVIDWVAARMAEADTNAHLRLGLMCPACRATWQASFDIAGFFWAELDYWARRLLDEVHLLASAYGWPEAEILGLSPARRRFYLERIAR